MKKILCIVLLLAMVAVAGAADLRKVGVTADGVVTSGPGYLKGVIVHTDGSAAVTVDLYDNATAASGSKLFSSWIVTSGASDRTHTLSFDGQECLFVNGMYVDITTTGSATLDFYYYSK